MAALEKGDVTPVLKWVTKVDGRRHPPVVELRKVAWSPMREIGSRRSRSGVLVPQLSA